LVVKPKPSPTQNHRLSKQMEGRKDGDDGNHHQQLDECERLLELKLQLLASAFRALPFSPYSAA